MKQAARQRSIQAFLLSGFVLLIASMALGQSQGSIEKVWVEYGVKVKDETGIRIHTKFSVKNSLNVACSILARVEREDGLSLSFNTNHFTVRDGKRVNESTYNTYATKDGKAVLMSKPFTPAYDPAEYADAKLFFPYWALNLQAENANKMKLIVTLSSDGKEFARSTVVELSLSLGKP